MSPKLGVKVKTATKRSVPPEHGFQKDCRDFIRLHAQRAKLDARLDVLKDRIKPELRNGRKSPRDLPFLLILQLRTRTLSDWKAALLGKLTEWLGNEAQAEKEIEAIQRGFPTEDTEALCVEINKAYAAKLHLDKTA